MSKLGKVALGVGGLTLAVGGMAAGVALKSKVHKAIEEGRERYQAFQHRIGISRGRKKLRKG